MDVSAALTNENRARGHGLTGKALATKTLRAGVTAVAGGTESLFCVPCLYLLFQMNGVCLLSCRGLGLSGLLRSARGGLDLGNLQLGELLTMTLEATIALALLELEDELLLTLELVDDLGRDLGLGELLRRR